MSLQIVQSTNYLYTKEATIDLGNKDYEWLHTVYSFKADWRNCGIYVFGGLAYVNQASKCFCFTCNLQHENRHGKYFSLHPNNRTNYCESNNMSYDRTCWEEYVMI